MANRFMTGSTCGNNVVIEFIGQDVPIVLNKIAENSNAGVVRVSLSICYRLLPVCFVKLVLFL